MPHINLVEKKETQRLVYVHLYIEKFETMEHTHFINKIPIIISLTVPEVLMEVDFHICWSLLPPPPKIKLLHPIPILD